MLKTRLQAVRIAQKCPLQKHRCPNGLVHLYLSFESSTHHSLFPCIPFFASNWIHLYLFHPCHFLGFRNSQPENLFLEPWSEFFDKKTRPDVTNSPPVRKSQYDDVSPPDIGENLLQPYLHNIILQCGGLRCSASDEGDDLWNPLK